MAYHACIFFYKTLRIKTFNIFFNLFVRRCVIGMRTTRYIRSSAVRIIKRRCVVVFILNAFFFQMEIGDIVRRASVKNRTMSQNTNRRHIDRRINIKRVFWLFTFFYTIYKHAWSKIISAAVSALFNKRFVFIVTLGCIKFT